LKFYTICEISFSHLLRSDGPPQAAGKVCRDIKELEINYASVGVPRLGRGTTLLKFGCRVVSIKIAGINISRGEKRFTLFS